MEQMPSGKSCQCSWSHEDVITGGQPVVMRYLGADFALAFANRRVLHLSQPVCHGHRVKPHTGADAERRNAASLRLFKDRDM